MLLWLKSDIFDFQHHESKAHQRFMFQVNGSPSVIPIKMRGSIEHSTYSMFHAKQWRRRRQKCFEFLFHFQRLSFSFCVIRSFISCFRSWNKQHSLCKSHVNEQKRCEMNMCKAFSILLLKFSNSELEHDWSVSLTNVSWIKNDWKFSVADRIVLGFYVPLLDNGWPSLSLLYEL